MGYSFLLAQENLLYASTIAYTTELHCYKNKQQIRTTIQEKKPCMMDISYDQYSITDKKRKYFI